MKLHLWSPVVALYSLAVLGSIIRCQLPLGAYSWHEVLPDLYFVPIVIAAINFGGRPAFAVAAASGAAHATVSALGGIDSWFRLSMETLVFVCVGLTAAAVARMNHATGAMAGGGIGVTPDRALKVLRSATEVPGLSEIVAGLVQRFRVPVSSITGAVWLLEDRQLPQEKRDEFIGIIRKESQNLDRTVSNVLDFTQLRKPHFRDVPLASLLDDVIQLSGPKDHGPYFLFRTNISPEIRHLRCDREQICRLLVNLALNSMQATPGGGQIILTARADRKRAIIAVKDHGHGIPPDIIDRIFDPFFTTHENSLGLGLTVARNIAIAHGGNISVNESSGKGTCVSLALPLDASVAHEHETHTGG